MQSIICIGVKDVLPRHVTKGDLSVRFSPAHPPAAGSHRRRHPLAKVKLTKEGRDLFAVALLAEADIAMQTVLVRRADASEGDPSTASRERGRLSEASIAVRLLQASPALF
jgi:hypothetical protein